ncbi:4151_t:CDS:2, partial [Cetraspora pellucida]
AVDELSIEELIDFIQDYLINSNLLEIQSFYLYTEASLEVTEELKLFYKSKNFLFIQYMIINIYKQKALHISTLKNYDYIIEDYTIRDVKIFNNFTDGEEKRKYVDHKTTNNHKKQRNRKDVTCSTEYLKQVYNLYSDQIDIIYPEYVKFINKAVLYEDCLNFKQSLIVLAKFEKFKIKRFKYYKKAAYLNNIEEIFQTGYCYRFELGVNKDIHQAVIYFILSASLGYSKGNFLTDLSYEHGEDVK